LFFPAMTRLYCSGFAEPIISKHSLTKNVKVKQHF
jgi:hypothetical protein